MPVDLGIIKRSQLQPSRAMAILACVSIIFTLVVFVHCQTGYPLLEFGDRVITNNSFIFRGDIGERVGNSLKCVTDYSDCCAGAGSDVGNWFARDGNEVHQGADGATDLYVTRGEGVVYLNRITGGTSGMWRCDIIIQTCQPSRIFRDNPGYLTSLPESRNTVA